MAKITPEIFKIILDKYNMGISISKISIELKYSTGTIYLNLLKNGIEIRGKGFYSKRPCSEKTKKLISDSHKGKHYPKLSEAKMGEKNSMYGTHGNSGSFKKGIRNSPETEFKRLDSTPLHRAILSLHKMKEWKAWVKEWDNFTCQHCGKRGGKLVSHHIVKFSDIRKKCNLQTIEEAESCDELWDVSNGITYCKQCHDLLKCGGGLL